MTIGFDIFSAEKFRPPNLEKIFSGDRSSRSRNLIGKSFYEVINRVRVRVNKRTNLKQILRISFFTVNIRYLDIQVLFLKNHIKYIIATD